MRQDGVGPRLMYLSRLQVSGLRASANQPMDVSVPGRFAVLLGANSAGKTTVSDAAYLVHRKTFPRLPRPSAAGLGPGPRTIAVEYRFEDDPAGEGPLGLQIQSQSGHVAPGTVAAAWTAGLSRDLGKISASVAASVTRRRSGSSTCLPGATQSMSWPGGKPGSSSSCSARSSRTRDTAGICLGCAPGHRGCWRT